MDFFIHLPLLGMRGAHTELYRHMQSCIMLKARAGAFFPKLKPPAWRCCTTRALWVSLSLRLQMKKSLIYLFWILAEVYLHKFHWITHGKWTIFSPSVWMLSKPGCGHWGVHAQLWVGHYNFQLLFALESSALRVGFSSLCGCFWNVELQGAAGLRQDCGTFQQVHRKGCRIFSSVSQRDKELGNNSKEIFQLWSD